MREAHKTRGESRKRRKRSDKNVALIIALVLAIGGTVGGTIAWLTDSSEKVENTFTKSGIDITLNESDADGDSISESNNYKMIPGWTIDKDPVVTVKAGSEDCWLFVEVTESTELELTNYIAYRVAYDDPETKNVIEGNGWIRGTADAEGGNGIPENVYYRKVAYNASEDQSFYVLGAGTYNFTNGTDDTNDDIEYSWGVSEVLTLPTVTETMMEAINEGNEPTLSFQAYAVQLFKTNSNQDEADTADEFKPGEAWAQAVAMKQQ